MDTFGIKLETSPPHIARPLPRLKNIAHTDLVSGPHFLQYLTVFGGVSTPGTPSNDQKWQISYRNRNMTTNHWDPLGSFLCSQGRQLWSQDPPRLARAAAHMSLGHAVGHLGDTHGKDATDAESTLFTLKTLETHLGKRGGYH